MANNVTLETLAAELSALQDAYFGLLKRCEALDTRQDTLSFMPRGTILAWLGKLDNVPEGWAICDGRPGTPDLRGRFLYGVASGDEAGAQLGGSDRHSHAVVGFVPGARTGDARPDTDGWHFDEPSRDKAPQATGFGHSHPVPRMELQEGVAQHTATLPPYATVIYIVRL